jgi:hypothetical protein
MSKRKAQTPVGDERQDVKQAVREVMDEIVITYANGATTFADSMTTSVSTMIDSFDDFFTRNLMADKPKAAEAFLDARLQSARQAQKLLNSKITALERLREKAAAQAKKA